jgi:hypothetical protein
VRPRVDAGALKEARAWEHALRFVFGGIVTVVVGLVARRWGPVIAGLFLAFPSIFPASITLVRRHDGRAKAVDDAKGACVGGAGMLAFSCVVRAAASAWRPAMVLAMATLAWAAVDLGAWAMVYGWRRR